MTETVFKIGVAKPGEHVLVEFSDTGCGMDTATLRKAFDPFFTTRRTGGGSGLGLSVVQGIVQAHGFALDLVSRVGEGTVFRLLLPLSQAEEGEPPSAEPAPSRGKGELVLVVDDESALLDFCLMTA